MIIGDVYYEKHTVVGVSHRNGEVSETQIEVIKDIIPLSVIDEIKSEIKRLRNLRSENYDLEDYCENFDARIIFRDDVLELIDQKVKEHTSCQP